MDTVQADKRVPAHVPPELVYEYDIFSGPGGSENPHWDVPRRLQSEAPRIFFSPLNGGHWLVSRADDIREMYRHPEDFSSNPAFNYQKAANPTRHLPLYYDPPEHAEARKIFASYFTPGAVARMEASIRELAVELIEEALPKGKIEFVADISKRFPVIIFLKLLANGPLDRREELIDMVDRYLRGTTPEQQQGGIRDLAGAMGKIIAERRENMGDDLLSRIIGAEFQGNKLTMEQILGASVFVFLAGLDTVAAMISWVAKYLAEHPAQYAWLLEDTATRIPKALEELQRVCGVAAPERGVTHDLEFRGVHFAKGDRIVFLNQISGMDPEEVDDPWTVDFTREISPHLIYGSGPHRCLGSHLARMEIRVFMEEWCKRIKKFSVAPGAKIHVHGGTVWIPDTLPLVFG